MESQESTLVILFDQRPTSAGGKVHVKLVRLHVWRRVVGIVGDQNVGVSHAGKNVLHEPGKIIRLDEEYGAF